MNTNRDGKQKDKPLMKTLIDANFYRKERTEWRAETVETVEGFRQGMRPPN